MAKGRVPRSRTCPSSWLGQSGKELRRVLDQTVGDVTSGVGVGVLRLVT